MKLMLLIWLAASALGQSSWLTSKPNVSADLSDQEKLTLRGSYLPGIGFSRPSFALVCGNGKLLSSSFNTVLSKRVSRASLMLVSGKLPVSVRIAGKKEAFKEWKVLDQNGSFQTDFRFAKELVTASLVDVYFSSPSGSRITAEFRPSPSDAPHIVKECGIR